MSEVTVTATETIVETPVVQTIVVETNRGIRGERGAPGVGGYVSKTSFAYNDVTILPLYLASTGDRIARVEVAITEAFADSGATLSVGDSGNTQQLMTIDQVKPSFAATFESFPLHLYNAPTQINLYINPGSSSAGSGFAYLYLA